MPHILVLYYTQTGQLKSILDRVVSDIHSDVQITFQKIEPENPFPFPWTAETFFDAMPEAVSHDPIPLKPFPSEVLNASYDFVILGYQPWFLNPSQPITSFLKSQDAKILSGKPVMTVIGCRNMWLHGQEVVKKHLIENGAHLKGNIVLLDKHPNLTSLLTVIRWAFKGQKEASKNLPEAGVSQMDIEDAKKYGPVISKSVLNQDFSNLHNEFIKLKAVELNSGLIILERRGIGQFRKWSKYIRAKGGPGAPERLGRVKLFMRLLMVGIFVLSPISNFTASIKKALSKKQLEKEAQYFRGIEYVENAL